jgi:hypothetical protein
MQVVNEERAKLSNGGRGGMRGGPGGMFRGGMGRGGPPGAFRGRGGGGRGGGSGWPSGAGGGYETQELFPVPSNKVYLLGYTCELTSGDPGRVSEEVSGSNCGSRHWLDPESGSI